MAAMLILVHSERSEARCAPDAGLCPKPWACLLLDQIENCCSIGWAVVVLGFSSRAVRFDHTASIIYAVHIELKP